MSDQLEKDEVETIDGFDIPKRELTEEEATREITLERFNEFHIKAGEDFCDQVGHKFNHVIFGGFLIAKYPEWSADILQVLNDKYCDLLRLQHPFTSNSEGDDYESYDKSTNQFYSDFAEFLNLTVAAKKRANQILIQVSEYYGN